MGLVINMAKRILFFAKKALFSVCILAIIPFLVMAQPQNTAQGQSHPGRNIVIVLNRVLTGLQNLVDKLFAGSGTQPNASSSQAKATSTQAYGHAVFNIGQEFLKAADQIVTSDEIKTLSQQQLDSTKGIVQTIDNIQNRSRLETFIFGPDYTDLRQLDQAVNDIGNKIVELNKTAGETVDPATKQVLQEQVGQMTKQKTQLDNFINENKNMFSLAGFIRGVLGF